MAENPSSLKEAYLAELFADIDTQTQRLAELKTSIEQATAAFENAEMRYKTAVDQYTADSSSKITAHIQNRTREAVAAARQEIGEKIPEIIITAVKEEFSKNVARPINSEQNTSKQFYPTWLATAIIIGLLLYLKFAH